MTDPGRAVLVVGAGYLGLRLAGLLAGMGPKVYALSRSGGMGAPAGEDAAAGVERIRADLLRDDLKGLIPGGGLDVVVCLAPGGSGPAGEGVYRQVYVDAQGRLLEALAGRESPPGRYVWVSSTSVYAEDGGGWVDESAAVVEGGTAGVLVEAERLALATGAWGTRATCLRLGGLYGPGRRRLIDLAASGRWPEDAWVRYTNRIHREDAALAGCRAVLSEGAWPGVVNVVDDAPVVLGEVLAYLRGLQGLGDVGELDRGGAGAGRVCGKRISNAALRGMGVRLGYPSYREGYGAMLGG